MRVQSDCCDHPFSKTHKKKTTAASAYFPRKMKSYMLRHVGGGLELHSVLRRDLLILITKLTKCNMSGEVEVFSSCSTWRRRHRDMETKIRCLASPVQKHLMNFVVAKGSNCGKTTDCIHTRCNPRIAVYYLWPQEKRK